MAGAHAAPFSQPRPQRLRAPGVSATPQRWLTLLLLSAAAVACCAARERYQMETNTTICAGGRLRGTYRRRTVTPTLLLQRVGEDVPCALFKMSCALRLELNATDEAVIVQDLGVGKGRLPLGTRSAYGEQVTHAALGRSRTASGALVPSGGAVLRNVHRRLLSKAELALVPASCYWAPNTLIGQLQRFEPGVAPAKLMLTTLAALSRASEVSLATTLVADALTLNRDRSRTRNMFTRANGSLLSLDNCCSTCWRLGEPLCPGLVARPNFLQGLNASMCDVALRPVQAPSWRRCAAAARRAARWRRM
jgi:hypothetical protein